MRICRDLSKELNELKSLTLKFNKWKTRKLWVQPRSESSIKTSRRQRQHGFFAFLFRWFHPAVQQWENELLFEDFLTSVQRERLYRSRQNDAMISRRELRKIKDYEKELVRRAEKKRLEEERQKNTQERNEKIKKTFNKIGDAFRKL